MDTKLKKSHKLTVTIITLCILIPALLLTALYPRVSEAMHVKREAYKKEYDAKPVVWTIESNFINYAMESGYYLYGKLLEEANPEAIIDFRVLDKYGWISDHYYLEKQCDYVAEYSAENGTFQKQNGELTDEENIGFVTLEFDENGMLHLQWDEDTFEVNYDDGQYYTDWRSKALESVDNYSHNVKVEKEKGAVIDEAQLQPKNFKITFAINEDMSFVWDANPNYWFTQPDSLMMMTGAEFLILAAGIIVAILAFLLPFIKKLETGWEKVFSLPLEIIGILSFGFVLMIYGMFTAMAYTCAAEAYSQMEFIGFQITPMVQWMFLLIANFLGWSACFFVEYVIVTSLRQLVFKPKYYLNHRILCVNLVKWLCRKCKEAYQRVTEIDLSYDMKTTVVKLLCINGLILMVPCLIYSILLSIGYYYWEWELLVLGLVIGIVMLGIYSAIMYVSISKKCQKIQTEYSNILAVTKELADGNLQIVVEKDLGTFKEMGDSLKKVQHGFQKAVIEEAKSQNMKTELITNVSHDLKTPLTAIITYIDLLKRDDITEEERNKYIETLEQKSARLKVLIEDLFEVSKAQSGNVTMNYMDIDVVSLMKQVKTEMEDQIEASNLVYKFNLPEERIVLSLDGQRTYRVFENLLSNTLKYAMPHSRVYIDVEKRNDKVRIVFRNISAEELQFSPEFLTERFVRGDVSRKSEGSGLGLAIAKSFVELQNGQFQIDVDGDLFKVTLTWSI